MSKQTDLWMPVYIGDYLRDTQRLSTEQHGAYFLLLLDYWTNGPPPANDEVLCSISRLKTRDFRKHKTTLLQFFTVVDGKLHHKRADAEKAKAEQHANRRSEKASNAANARWHGSNDDAPSNATSNASGHAPECPKPSPSFPYGKALRAKDVVFREGLPLLTGAGVAEARARSLLGKGCKRLGDEGLVALIGQAKAQCLLAPGDWLAAAINKPTEEDGLSAAVADLAARKKAQAA